MNRSGACFHSEANNTELQCSMSLSDLITATIENIEMNLWISNCRVPSGIYYRTTTESIGLRKAQGQRIEKFRRDSASNVLNIFHGRRELLVETFICPVRRLSAALCNANVSHSNNSRSIRVITIGCYGRQDRILCFGSRDRTVYESGTSDGELKFSSVWGLEGYCYCADVCAVVLVPLQSWSLLHFDR